MQVIAELAVGDRLSKITIARGDDADVDIDFLITTETSDAFVFDRLEHLGLQAKREACHFVEKQCAALGSFEETPARRLGISERAALVPEQFRLG